MRNRTTSRPYAVVLSTLVAGWIGIESTRNAHGQVATDITYKEGPGLKIGNGLVLHPGFAMEMRYDSNVLFADRARRDAPYLRLIGHVHLATLSPQRLSDPGGQNPAFQRVVFRLQIAAGYREYLSDDDAITNQRAIELDAGTELRINASRHFAIIISDDFARQVTAQNAQVLPGEAAPTTSSRISRDINRLVGKVKLAPGGGLLTFDVGYALNADIFEEESFSVVNRLAHEILFDARWRLLPKTAAFLEVRQQFYDYYNAPANSPLYINSTPFRVFAGLSGLITPRLSALLKVGYGNGLYDAGKSFNSVLGLARFEYFLGPMAKIWVGYERSFMDSIFGNYNADHHAFIGFDQSILSRFVLHLGGGYRFRSYQNTAAFLTTSAGPGPGSLDVHLLEGNVTFDWQVQDWVYLGIGYDLQVQEYETLPVGEQRLIGLVDYVRHQMYGRVGISY